MNFIYLRTKNNNKCMINRVNREREDKTKTIFRKNH